MAQSVGTLGRHLGFTVCRPIADDTCQLLPFPTHWAGPADRGAGHGNNLNVLYRRRWGPPFQTRGKKSGLTSRLPACAAAPVNCPRK
jgi:hypothetical protein